MPNFFTTLAQVSAATDLYSKISSTPEFKALNQEVASHGFSATATKLVERLLLIILDPIVESYVSNKKNDELFKKGKGKKTVALAQAYLAGMALELITNSPYVQVKDPTLPLQVGAVVQSFESEIKAVLRELNLEEGLTNGRQLYLGVVSGAANFLARVLGSVWKELNREASPRDVAALIHFLLQLVTIGMGHVSFAEKPSDDDDSSSDDDSDVPNTPRSTHSSPGRLEGNRSTKKASKRRREDRDGEDHRDKRNRK